MPRPEKPPPSPTGLYYARRSRGMSKTALSRRSKQHKQTIDKLERGIMKLTRAWAEKFAPALRYTAEQILFWDVHRASGELPEARPARRSSPRI